MDSAQAVSKRGKRPWARSAGTRSVFRVQVPLRKTVELQITHHYKLGKRAGWPGIFYFSGQMKTRPPRFLLSSWALHSVTLGLWSASRSSSLPTAQGKWLLQAFGAGSDLVWLWGQLSLCKWSIYKSISSFSCHLLTSEHCFPRPRTCGSLAQ